MRRPAEFITPEARCALTRVTAGRLMDAAIRRCRRRAVAHRSSIRSMAPASRVKGLLGAAMQQRGIEMQQDELEMQQRGVVVQQPKTAR